MSSYTDNINNIRKSLKRSYTMITEDDLLDVYGFPKRSSETVDLTSALAGMVVTQTSSCHNTPVLKPQPR